MLNRPRLFLLSFSLFGAFSFGYYFLRHLPPDPEFFGLLGGILAVIGVLFFLSGEKSRFVIWFGGGLALFSQVLIRSSGFLWLIALSVILLIAFIGEDFILIALSER